MEICHCACNFVPLDFVVFDEVSFLGTITQSLDFGLKFLRLLLEALKLSIILESDRAPGMLGGDLALRLIVG